MSDLSKLDALAALAGQATPPDIWALDEDYEEPDALYMLASVRAVPVLIQSLRECVEVLELNAAFCQNLDDSPSTCLELGMREVCPACRATYLLARIEKEWQ